MVPMPFIQLTEAEKTTLLDTALQSIKYGQQYQQRPAINPVLYTEALRQIAATFVTLEINHQLRGCIGTLSAYQTLIEDVAEHAYGAAYLDPRFTAVSADEIPLLDIHISILTPAVPMQFTSEEDLISQLKPGEDGLILELGQHKATFLPAVWESLPDASGFLQQLKRKAGLSPHDWDNNIKVSRYNSISIP